MASTLQPSQAEWVASNARVVAASSQCVECGHVGCCDTSPNQHASKHNAATGHPIITSFEPGERWFYDYRTGEFFAGPKLHAPHSHPLDQPVPDRPKRCLQTGKLCFTNRGRLFGVNVCYWHKCADTITRCPSSRAKRKTFTRVVSSRPKTDIREKVISVRKEF
jgi:hypothetical protein